ncbi:MAG: tripartite tricarboxylate transporter TctB family protein [Ideonella sp.]|nr:tripartite tricarboxylate transporter TctB family protein [Ideonella sp.]MBL0150182.1 tripartite tricarboxylate transporter TctB family protein [Ideonella sp.]
MSAPGDESPSARGDLRQGLGWMALGVAVFIGSVTMDRLERQDVNPYTVPGLLPGLLGLAMVLLGGILALRSWRRGALQEAIAAHPADQHEQRRRVLIVMGLCLGYAVVLVGHGLPFWLASAIYVTGSILILDRMSREPEARRMSAGRVLKALVIGGGAGVITHLVFQSLFLVRLP